MERAHLGLELTSSQPGRINTTLADRPLISAIVPAYNEAQRVGGVLAVLRQVELLSEIIVVDDGSLDRTAEKIHSAVELDTRIRLLSHPVNMGKGQAVFTGFRSTPAVCLILLDADLLGLKSEHVLDLIRPVLEGHADMTIGQFRKGYWRTDLAHWATPWLSGQRCFRSELLESISENAASGYGIETALTVAASRNGWRCLRVPMEGVWHLPSEHRRGYGRGMRTRARMYGQIIHAWYLAGGLSRLVKAFHRESRGG